MIFEKCSRRLPGYFCVPVLVLFFFLIGGCGLASKVGGLKNASSDAVYDPPLGSAAFQRLRLEKTKSIVILNIEGDDVHGNMKKIYRAILDKGYAIRDVNDTIQVMRRSGLLGKKSTTPENIKKAAGFFTEQTGLAGRVEIVQASPPRVQIALYLIDLKKQKIIWTIKSSFVGRYFSSGNPFEQAATDAIARALSGLPRANP